MSKKAKIPNVKEYYKNKSMPMRYVIFGFLVILVLVQLTLPSRKQYREQKKHQEEMQTKLTHYFQYENQKDNKYELTLLKFWDQDPIVVDQQRYHDKVLFPLLSEKRKYLMKILLSL